MIQNHTMARLKKNIIYSKIVIDFFKKKIKNTNDILNITNYKNLLKFFIEETKIAKSKLEYLTKINQNIFFKFLSYKNEKDVKITGFSIIRSGSRDINLKFKPYHLKNINKLLELFNFSIDILETK